MVIDGVSTKELKHLRKEMRRLGNPVLAEKLDKQIRERRTMAIMWSICIALWLAALVLSLVPLR